MSATNARNTDETPLEEIARQAVKTRQLLIDAVSGLDRIIDLATKEGRTDIVNEAEKQRIAAIDAVSTFNEKVADEDDIDADVVHELAGKAKQSDKDMRELLNKLNERVGDVEKTVQDHEGRIKALEDVHPKDDDGKFVNITTFVDDRVKKGLEKTRQFVNDTAGREVWSEQQLQTKGSLVTFVATCALFTILRWLGSKVFGSDKGFLAALGWWPGFVIAGILTITVLLWQNRRSNNFHFTTAPAVREEGN